MVADVILPVLLPSRWSDDVIRRQAARMRFVAVLHLERGVADPEAILELVCGLNEKRIVRPRARPHEMRRQRYFRSADVPDMEIVHGDHTG